jgi:hypothetical protein
MNSQIRLPDVEVKEIFADPSVIQEKLGLSAQTLKGLRKDGALIQGIHFVEVNPRLILYNLPLLMDWVVNRDDPQTHMRAIENFQACLLSNQRKGRGRPKSKQLR